MYPAQPNQSLIDGLAVLQALTMCPDSVGGRELARQLGMEPTRVHRLLKTLAGLGLARQDVQRRYVPGPGIHVLAAQSLYGSGLLRRLLPELPALHATGHLVALGVLWHDHVCYLYHGDGSRPPEAGIATTGLFPASQSGIGHVLLAAMSAGARQPHGRQAVDGSPDTLADIRARGWARLVRRRRPLLATLAVPVGDPPVAALALAGPIRARDVDGLLPVLNNAAMRIAAETKREQDHE